MDYVTWFVVFVLGSFIILKLGYLIHYCVKDNNEGSLDSISEDMKYLIDIIERGGSSLEVLGMLPYVNINSSIPKYGSLLHLAVIYGDNEIIETLLHNGSNINATDHHNMTPLLIACQCDQLENFLTLMNYRPDVNIMSIQKYTPLVWAVTNGNWRMVNELIMVGAKNIRTLHGFDCFDICNSINVINLLNVTYQKPNR